MLQSKFIISKTKVLGRYIPQMEGDNCDKFFSALRLIQAILMNVHVKFKENLETNGMWIHIY